MSSTSNILARLAVLGNELNARCPDTMHDLNLAPRMWMTLGATRCAYTKIREGADPLTWLYKLEELANFWTGEWPGLTRLIDRLTIELDVQ